MNDWTCEVCEKPLGYEPQFCCSGYECGCMGLPIDPPVCSNKCYDILIGKCKKPENTGRNNLYPTQDDFFEE